MLRSASNMIETRRILSGKLVHGLQGNGMICLLGYFQES